jgi:acetoin:2,6-dichlorophenolindophenol oxidoreductase subunit alpha
VPVGVGSVLRKDHRITSTHRGHGHGVAKGADLDGMMLELYGRANGLCGGKGGSMHVADFSVGVLGANGIAAGGIPIAVGAAQGLGILGSDAVVACFFGEGAVNRGPFLEGLNWAAIYQLPVLFVCEDNTVSAFTHSRTTTAGPGPLARV